jgi:hypothetical protein
MAGKLIADQIEHSTAGSLDTSYVVNGSAKAWTNFVGTGTAAINRSSNSSGLTDNGTGDYTVSFTTSLVDANFSFAMAANQTSTGTGMVTGDSGHQTTLTAGSIRWSFTGSSSNTVTDVATGSVMVHGDLA